MDSTTRAKIDSLLYHLRMWVPGSQLLLVEELAKRYQLDPFIVRRIASTEGIELQSDEDDDGTIDTEKVTQPIDVEEVQAAIEAARRKLDGEA